MVFLCLKQESLYSPSMKGYIDCRRNKLMKWGRLLDNVEVYQWAVGLVETVKTFLDVIAS